MGGFDLSTGMGTRTGQKSTGWFQPNATHKFATHFIALDFRVCGVIPRKTLGFDKLSKDSTSEYPVEDTMDKQNYWLSLRRYSDTSPPLSRPSAFSNVSEP